ncbi:MAG: dihydrofolate synthase/folylpolyglutamate synthase [Cellvibrionaceae bacterium]|jgi:dihydrofolate synthase/folylpolyglutamate synthase
MKNNKLDAEDFYREHSWLFSLVNDPEGERFNVSKTSAQRQLEMQEAMERTADFLAYAGNPEAQFPAVHVTGTSGKGSVSMMTGAMLQGMGLRTGLHTSPYLQMPTEKLMVNGSRVSLGGFASLVGQFRDLHHKWGEAKGKFDRLRYTEAWTAITFMWLAQQNLDFAVVETGMGGRLDPTNLMPSELAIITNVAFDHIKSLGPELTDIARHKAGIIKEGKPAITAVTQPDVLSILEKEAAEKEAKLYLLNRDFSYEIHDAHTITIKAPFKQYKRVKIGPVGRYQLGNAALAITALDVLVGNNKLVGPVNTAALANFSCPGRMEQVSNKPLVLLDGAHNPHKMSALVTSLKDAFPNKKITAITGSIANKEVTDILQVLVPVVDRIIATAPNVPGKPAVDPGVIRDTIAEMSSIPTSTALDIRSAVDEAMRITGPDDLILITGSLYLVGEARELWYPLKE